MRATAESIVTRENLPLNGREADLVDRLRTAGTLERSALEMLAPGVGTSKAAVLRAALHVGLDRLQETAMELGYQQMAADEDAAEAADRRARIELRRARRAGQGEA